MRIKHKFVMLSVTALLAMSFASQSFAASTPFNDVNQSSVKDKIASLQERGVVKGVSADEFKPDAAITAAQGIQLIVNALNLNIDNIRFFKAPLATDYFAKANNDAWYADALIIAAHNGLELPADLDPAKSWTKEEFIQYLMKAAEVTNNLPLINIKPLEFADEADLDVQYQGAVQRALVLKIAELDADGKLHPKEEISRADAAVLTYNVLEYIAAHPAPTPAPVEPETGSAE
ncbi:S-layer homology domain-containing protein [Paenibacillus sp. FSL H8-0537]|uniref:S-layer homology domain-containing protein n=1 Tax=Paenibacillus sp. FSL H8-0537 TaxID=2921399 RepID=UPI003101560D